MNFETYYPLALRTAKRFPTRLQDLRHAVLGLITETGEFTSEVKRIVVYEKIMTTEMRAHMLEELGDANWYVPLGLMALGMDKLPHIGHFGGNVDKLDDIAIYMNIFCATVAAYADESEAVMMRDAYEIAQALAAIVYLIDHAAILLGTTGYEVRADNIAKLRKRYPDAYSNEAAEARADKGGLAHTAS